MILRFFFLILLICFSFTGVAQSYLFNAQYLSAEDGLLGRRISAIVQDDDGFIWISTNEGLNRFDGHKFLHFTKESHGLLSNQIQNLKKDDQGNIWIDYPRDQYAVLPIQILIPKTHQLIAYKNYIGKQFKAGYEKLKLANRKHWDKVTLQTKSVFFQYHSKKGMTELSKNFAGNNPFNTNYWTIDDDALAERKLDNSLLRRFSIPNYKMTQISSLANKWLLITAQDESKTNVLIIKHINKSNYTLIKSEKIKIIITSKIAAINNKIYFSYQDTVRSIDLKSVINNNKIRTLFIDKNNDIWIGTTNGFYIINYKKNTFTTYFKNALSPLEEDYSVRGLWANKDFLYSIAPQKAFRWSFKTNKLEVLPLSNESRTRRAITSNPNRQFWIGMNQQQPLEQIDTLTGQVIKRISSEYTRQIWTIFEDKEDQIWIGDRRRGLYIYQPKTSSKVLPFIQYNGFEDLRNKTIIHITADTKDSDFLWISAQSGWYHVHINKGIMAHFNSEQAKDFYIPSDDIHYTYQDKSGVYWLGTALGGLLKVTLTEDFKIKSVRQFMIKDGLPSNTIYGIFEDDNDFLWMSSNNGIIKFNKKNTEVHSFSMEDGLPHYEFNRGAYFQRTDGTIFFGGLNGAVSFQPNDFEITADYDIPLKISRCEKYTEADEKIIDITQNILQDNKIILRPDDHLVTLYVSLQDYFNASKLKYSYKIEGFQKEFTIIKEPQITLSGLPYGRYTLHIKGQGRDNRYSTQELKIIVIVLRPFYLTWWFFVLVAIVLALSIWQFLKWRVQKLKAEQQALEIIVANRTRELAQDKAIIEQQAEELRSLDKMKSRFFANISHELRTPLTLILSPINSMVNSEKLDNRNFTYAMMIKQNAQRLLKRVNEILDLTKLEAKKMKLQPQPIKLYDYTKRLAVTFESFAQQQGQVLLFKYKLNKHLQILLDKDKFEHIFNNYLSNAIRYTPKNGEIVVELTESQINKKNEPIEHRLLLKVQDTGQGISLDDLPKVFDRFFQAENTVNKAGGTGIGLSISKEIAQLMNGKLWVESELQKGSTFYFEMPYQEYLGMIEPSSELITIAPETFSIIEKKKNNKNNPTILLVEDNAELRQYIQTILANNYHVVTAENGKIALEWLEKPSTACPENSVDNHQPSVIISDIMMPIMDGFELLETLKLSKKWRHIPVIMLTARSNMKAKLKALRIGVDDYMLKPFDEEELLTRIENLLERYEERQLAANINEKLPKITNEKSTIAISENDTKWLEQLEFDIQSEINNTQFSIYNLAIELNLSERQFQRKVKKLTGLTPNKYLREIKLQAAREILEASEIQTVNEVAYAVGFDTPKYFSKIYEQRFGKRPIEYLK
jgi:signal transduction histidine kinase/DNA-binding response OmpR family regulator/ligand-binding sensor domain-containing protein